MSDDERGLTLVELMIGMAVMAILTAGFATLLRSITAATTRAQTGGEAQEGVRQGLMKIEEALLHANEVTVASATLVEFVADADQSPGHARDGDPDADGIPNYRDADRDSDAALILPATAQWQAGFNLKDDDEDGDGNVDLRLRLYLSNGELWLDESVNGSPWGGRARRLMPRVSTFSLAYFGNKANPLGRNLDLGSDGSALTGDAGENDGIITAAEMDMVPAPGGMGNRSGAVDTANERRYITAIRVNLGSDRNADGRTDYAVETDVYPPFLPLKAR